MTSRAQRRKQKPVHSATFISLSPERTMRSPFGRTATGPGDSDLRASDESHRRTRLARREAEQPGAALPTAPLGMTGRQAAGHLVTRQETRTLSEEATAATTDLAHPRVQSAPLIPALCGAGSASGRPSRRFRNDVTSRRNGQLDRGVHRSLAGSSTRARRGGALH